ncbi:hypothetical protein [Alkalicella caledoniensis]|nr:hypothetical protein [Alkalicella caledoniensis]
MIFMILRQEIKIFCILWITWAYGQGLKDFATDFTDFLEICWMA